MAARMFVYLFEENDTALEFLQEAELLRSVLLCPKCGQNMTMGKNGQTIHKCCWRWNNGSSTDCCTGPRNVRNGLWGTRSKLTLGGVMLLAYDIIARVPFQSIEREYELKSHPRNDWFQFCTLVELDYMETTSEKIGI